MESENVRQRTTDEPNVDTTKNNDNYNNNKGRRQRRTAMARRGLRSLAVAVAIPVSLHLALFSYAHLASAKPSSGFPSPWLLHAIAVGTASLMGLSAWLVWAEGGFHRNPIALAFFMCYLALSLAWDPIVFGMDAIWIGLLVSVAMLGALAGCSRIFKEVNPIAGDLVMLCVIWAGFVISLNLKLLFL